MNHEETIEMIRHYLYIEKDIRFNLTLMKLYHEHFITPMAIPPKVEAHITELLEENIRHTAFKAEFLRELNKIPNPSKQIILLFYLKNKSWVQIARELSYSESHCRRLRDLALSQFGGEIGRNPLLRNALKKP